MRGAEFPDELISVEGFELSAPDGFVDYRWFLDGETIDGAVGNTYTATENGAYSVQVTNTDGCIRTSEAVMLVVNGIRDIGIERLALTPNPFRDGFQLEFHTTRPGAFRIWMATADGKLIWEKTLSVGQQLKEWISTPDLPAGVYLFGVEKEGRKVVQQVVKR